MKFHLFAFFIAIGILSACQSKQSDSSTSSTAASTAPAPAANTPPTPATDDPRGKVVEILRGCAKVEYMVYDAGITFESESNNEVLRFFSYVANNIPGSGCPPEKYDGNAVFKNAQGEIKFQLQFNLPALSNCNRVTFKVEDKQYDRTLDPNGLQFFGQVLNMRNQAGQGQGQGH